MMVLLPMMWVMGKINFEEGNILLYARIAFFTAQLLQAVLALYIKMQVVNTADKRTKILVPEAKPPSFNLTPPEERESVPMTETTYYDHESAKVKELLTQCVMGVCISSFIHFKFGVNQVVVMQSVMIPLNLFDQPLFRKYILRSERVWEEQTPGEITQTKKQQVNKASEKGLPSSESLDSFEPVLDAKGAITNAWDYPTLENANLLFQMVKDTPNVVSKDDGWTALMVLAAMPIDTTSMIKQLLQQENIQVELTDNDGWNVLHWCAYHNSPKSAQVILSTLEKPRLKALCTQSSRDGKSPIELAQEQKNDSMVMILASFADETLSDESAKEETIRQRKGIST